jgi:hypothetical protein
MILVAASLFAYSIKPLMASPAITNKLLDDEKQSGRYMFAYADGSNGETLIMYDTQTANSICYSWNNDKRIWSQDAPSEQLPKYPFQK